MIYLRDARWHEELQGREDGPGERAWEGRGREETNCGSAWTCIQIWTVTCSTHSGVTLTVFGHQLLLLLLGTAGRKSSVNSAEIR